MIRYQKLASMLRQIVEKKAQLKNVLYSGVLSTGVGSAYSLLSTIINNIIKFRECLDLVGEKSKQQISNSYLFFVLVGEWLHSGKIQGGGKLKRIIINNQELLPKIQKHSKINKKNVQIRIRQNSDSYEHWKNIFNSQPMPIIKNIYNFNANDYSDLINNNSQILTGDGCVIQSYSSALPAYLLLQGARYGENQILKKFNIIDACSAPGNKTLQLSEYLNTNGVVFCFEKDKKRFELLNKNLNKYKTQNTKTINMDFTLTDPNDYQKVKFILLDPSCSGSGMLTNIQRDHQQKQNEKELCFQDYCDQKYNNLDKQQQNRVQKLHEFQLNLLKHAAKFKPIRISYSTCSIYKRENQDVMKQFLQSQPTYRIKKNKDVVELQLLERGFGKGMKNCIRVDPRKQSSDGFFVCILKRYTK